MGQIQSRRGAAAKQVAEKRQKSIAPVILIAFAAMCVIWLAAKAVMGAPTTPIELTAAGDVPVVQDYLPEGCAARPGTKRRVKYIVIHETANTAAGANAKAHDEYLHTICQTQQLSWHYTVDDHEIYHHLPDNESAYHASDHQTPGGGNLNGIGIEMCVNSDGDYEQTLRNAEVLTARLLLAYHLTVDDVKKHQDFCGKVCPKKLIEADRWEEFLQGVQEAYSSQKAAGL